MEKIKYYWNRVSDIVSDIWWSFVVGCILGLVTYWVHFSIITQASPPAAMISRVHATHIWDVPTMGLIAALFHLNMAASHKLRNISEYVVNSLGLIVAFTLLACAIGVAILGGPSVLKYGLPIATGLFAITSMAQRILEWRTDSIKLRQQSR